MKNYLTIIAVYSLLISFNGIAQKSVFPAGNIGFGITTPVNQLDVNKGMAIGSPYIGVSVAPLNGLIIAGATGIGTPIPKNRLDVNGGISVGTFAGVSLAPTNGLIISGQTGIGTTNPQSQLDVNGGLSVGSYAGFTAAPANGLIVSGSVGLGTATPNTTSAVLDISSANKGILIPRITYVDRMSIVGVDGLLVYQSDNNQSPLAPPGFYYYEGASNSWKSLNGNSVGGGGWLDYAIIADKSGPGAFTTVTGLPPDSGQWNERSVGRVIFSSGSAITVALDNSIRLNVPGTYFVRASVPGYHCKRTKIIFTDDNSGSVLLTGTSEQSFWDNRADITYDAVSVRSFVEGIINVTSTRTIKLLQYFERSTKTSTTESKAGFGVPTNAKAINGTATDEYYSQIFIQRIN